jgi:hypothetical protein
VPLDDLVTQLAVPEREKVNVHELLKALGRLPFNQRAAIAMRELEGRSYEEIAETLDVTVPAVEALLVRARRTLRAQHAAVRGLAVVQLPRSLRSLWQNGEATSAVAGGLLGGGALVKAAAVLVAGVVAGGAGYAGVQAGIGSKPALREPGPRPPMRAAQAAHGAAASSSARPAASARRNGPEPSGTARQMPAAGGASTGVVVASGGAAPPAGHAIPDAIWPTPAKSTAVAVDVAAEPPQKPVRPRPSYSLPSPLVPPLSGPLLPAPTLPRPPLPAPPVPAPPPPPVQPPPVADVPLPAVPTAPVVPATPDLPRVPTLPAPPPLP